MKMKIANNDLQLNTVPMEKLVFDETENKYYILLDDIIEFYYQYCKWKNNCKEANEYSDFEYVTEDNGVNPILKFQYIGNNNWRIDSCYKEIRRSKYIFD